MRVKRFMFTLFLSLIFILVGCTSENQSSSKIDAGEDITGENTDINTEGDKEELQVELTFLGRASVRININDGRTIYIDPYAGAYKEYGEEADLVLVTHQHDDHNKIGLTTLKDSGEMYQCPMDIKSGDVIESNGITIEAVDAYNSNHARSQSCGFIITIDDIVIYHAGDTSTTTQMSEFDEKEIDYALLVMDGYYNMDAVEAMEVAELIDAEAVIPIHSAKSSDYNEENARLYTLDNRILVLPGETISLYDISESNGVGEPIQEAISRIMDERVKAIKLADYDLYMSSINQVNQFFYNEQERWFMEMTNSSIQNISFDVLDIEMIHFKEYVVYVNQTHENVYSNEGFDFGYPLQFKYIDGEWKDFGYAFEKLKTDRFIVKYMYGEEKVDEFVQMLNDAYDHLEPLYEEKPVEGYEMKLFYDQEMLRQRSIPSNLWLFTGWAEPDESMKLYTGHDSTYSGYAGVVQHELVHHITINICNNNLPLWLLEGIAMLDGSAYYGIENSRLLSSMTKESVSLTINYLEENDLYHDITTDQIYAFYATSFMYSKYLLETYGRETYMDIFYEAGKKPFHDSTLNNDFEMNNQITADEVLLTVLDKTKEEISEEYLVWLNDNFDRVYDEN